MARMIMRLAVIYHWDEFNGLGFGTAFDGVQGQSVTLKVGDFRGSKKGRELLSQNDWGLIRGMRVLFVTDPESGGVIAWAFDGEKNRASLERWLDACERPTKLQAEQLPAVVGKLTSQDLADQLKHGLGRESWPKRRPRLRIAQ